MKRPFNRNDIPPGSWVSMGGGYTDNCDLIGATAAQRADALGITLGLWKEGE